jgi:hypothetical protein
MPRTAEEKAEYLDYINHSPVWKAKSHAVVKVRAGGICELMLQDGLNADGTPRMCRCTARADHCHHLTYDNLFDEPLEDLQALCNLHHKAVHVWDRHPRCGCGRPIFDTIEDAIAFVAEDEWRDWDELYDEVPTSCSRCLQAASKEGRSNGQHPTDSNTRMTMNTKRKVTSTGKVGSDRAKALASGNGAPYDDDEDDDGDGRDAAGNGQIVAKVVWVRSTAMEAMIESHGVEWDYEPDVPLSEVDVKKSRGNMARLGPRLIQHVIDAMIYKAKGGKTLYFPPLIAYRDENGRLVLADGNHRDEFLRLVQAALAGMYLLRAPGPKQIKAITLGANSGVGTGQSEDEKLRYGMSYWSDNQPGCTYEEAAAEAGVSDKVLTRHLKADELAFRLSSAGDIYVPGAHKLAVQERFALTKIKNDAVLQHAVRGLLTIPNHGGKNAEALQRAIKKAKPSNEAKQLRAADAEIERQLKDATLAKTRRGQQSPQTQVMRQTRAHHKAMRDRFDGQNPKDVLWDPKMRREFVAENREHAAYMDTIARDLE